MNKTSLKKILEHPDKDEIIAKSIIGISAKDIYEFLKAKYANISESKFVIAEKSLQSFQDNYLDVYNLIQEDIAKSKLAVSNNTEDQLSLSVQNNSAYKSKMMELASKEIDVRKIIANLCVAIETRLAQVFDEIQSDPRNINTRVDRLLIEYTDTLGNILEKYYKFTEAPSNQIINNNVTLQVVDQHISVFHDVIRDVLSQMDLQTSLYFMEVFHQKMEKLKAPDKDNRLNTDLKLAEAQVLNETINKKLNE
jgi:hypothetical protein